MRDPCARELGQVSVGHLTVSNDCLGGHIGVRDIIGPEFMPQIGAGAVEDIQCRAGRLAFTDKQPHQAALSDRAGREVAVHSGASLLVATHEFADRARDLAGQLNLPCFIAGGSGDSYEAWIDGADPAGVSPGEIDERQLLVINYTSGTTGRSRRGAGGSPP